MAEYGPQTGRDVGPAVVVVGRQFSIRNAVNFTVTRTASLFSPNDRYKVMDINDDVVFKGKGFFDLRGPCETAPTPNHFRRCRHAVFSWHQTWRVFRGESTSPNDLLFSVRKPQIFQWKDNCDVILATNAADQAVASPCAFKIISRCTTCTICIGESDEIIAQMDRKTAFLARDKLEVTVNPNVDYVFILSLIIVLEEIKASRRRSNAASVRRRRRRAT
ncbi:protein LURP-one-related 15-like [Curcuma longa]|uniref:protein LURP-one-related 15-like n=1 Tax=Curcuma longa TaxID=136217 RepID=UPI003D9DE02E